MHLQVGSICKLNLPAVNNRFRQKYVQCQVEEIRLHYDNLERQFSQVMIFVNILGTDDIRLVDETWLEPVCVSRNQNEIALELRAA